MASNVLLWYYLELEYFFKKNWVNTKSKRERRILFREKAHFLKRQYKIERSESYALSLIVGFIISLSIVVAYDLERWLVLGAYPIVTLVHHSIITFFWKVKTINLIRFKSKFFPIDQKFEYRINSNKNDGKLLFDLYYETYLGMTDSFGHLEYSRSSDEEQLKRRCFDLIDDVKKSINITDKNFDDLSIEQKELIKSEWSITGGYKGKLSFAKDFPHTQYSRFYLFYSIEWKKIGCIVKCVVLSEPECYLLELA
jgi:hypothetical protein